MKKLLALIATTLVAACSTAPQGADTKLAADGAKPWCHWNGTATNGAQIKFDYQVSQGDDHNVAYSNVTPAWLNLTSAAFTGRESVTAVVLDLEHHNRCTGCIYQNEVRQLPMSFDANERKFTADVRSLPLYHYEHGDDIAWTHLYEFAVVIDGQWLEVPNADGSHNFRFDPETQAPAECQR